MADRESTPDRINADGSLTITAKRACNGCDAILGDLTEQETAAAIAGRPLPDVRRECPTCGPAAPEPACQPMQIVAGDAYCVTRDCGHDITSEAGYCGEVSEETVCATHSKFTPGFEEACEVVTHAEPWPCQYQPKEADRG
ncbi:hypothetical protein AB0O20_06810 [Streptomyces kronopolitis]|uniref:hypothetical protein n=1 Tax=Streptomyces kronopolitis TaxID=1612435 RepID=UPI003437E6DF